MHQTALVLTAFAYLAAYALLYGSMQQPRDSWRRMAVALTVAAAGLHAWSQYHAWISSTTAQASILTVLSLCALVVILLILVSQFARRPLFDAGFVALPLAAVVVLMEWLLDAPSALVTLHPPGFMTHIVSSVTAFGVFSIAGIYAVFTTLIDYFLRRHHLNRLMQSLPALEVLEQVMFQLIALGMLLLSVSLASGLLFVDDLFAQHLVHKTVLSLLSWFLFGTLLWGRHFRGWRGGLAVRLTLAGIGLLLLSYFGSKLVLEVLLDRSWQS